MNIGETTFVAGATGKLGRKILDELKGSGHRTRALTRDGPHALPPAADEVRVADARKPESLEGLCEGARLVISAMGASLRLEPTGRGGGGYRGVDYLANRNLLAEARKSGVRKFVYVSLACAEKLRGTAYADAHEDFVRELESSGIDYTIVRPTGFFYAFEEIFKMAARGRAAVVGRGDARTNPVDERDVARACVEALGAGEREVSVGGPEVYTRREIVELAFEALGRRPKIVSVPAGLIRALILPVRLFDRRLYELLDFGVAVGLVDAIAPPTGTRSLRDHFSRLAEESAGARQ
ncbi:MAG: SDR family oxidoreductase [Verrucomicrobiales bacterium]